jgi:hypothetical protein
MGKSIFCYECKAIKENPVMGYCLSCNRKKAYEWRERKKKEGGLCKCGKPRASYSPRFCIECTAIQNKKWRETHPETPEQRNKRNIRVRSKYVKRRAPKKVKLNPELWIKPTKKLKRKTVVNGVRILCGRSNCENTDNFLSNGWCKSCAAAYQRERLKYHDLAPRSEEQTIRHRVRALTRSYIKAGKLIKGACEVCRTNDDIEAHHDDYAKPMDIRWLCRKHHREHHLRIKI